MRTRPGEADVGVVVRLEEVLEGDVARNPLKRREYLRVTRTVRGNRRGLGASIDGNRYVEIAK